MQKARLLNAEDIITDDIYTITEGPDRKGNYLLVNDNNGRRARAHPTRILRLNDGGSVVLSNASGFHAHCPYCNADVSVEVGQEYARCKTDGMFQICWKSVAAGVRPAQPEQDDPGKKTGKAQKQKKQPQERTTRRSKASTNVDFEAMKKVGELWTKTGVEFDYPGYEVKAHVFIICGEAQRKWCFNSYNGTWGKKSKDSDLKLFMDDKPGDNGRLVGYYIKGDIDQERRKLERGGYVLED